MLRCKKAIKFVSGRNWWPALFFKDHSSLKGKRNKMVKKIASLFVLFTVVLSSGCASFKAHNLPEVADSEYQISASEKTKVFSRWSFETTSSVINKDAAAAIHKSAFEKAVQESGCCEIVEGPTQADLVVDGTIKDHSDSAVLIPAVITGLSLYTIPSWVTETVDLKVSAESGDKKNSYELKDSFKMVQWLPMMFVFPFTGGPVKNSEELRSNTYKNLVLELRGDEFL